MKEKLSEFIKKIKELKNGIYDNIDFDKTYAGTIMKMLNHT